MPGLINNITDSNSSLFGNSWNIIKGKFFSASDYAYNNYYLKLATATYVYFNGYFTDVYRLEKQLNKIKLKDRNHTHLTLTWHYILQGIPVGHSWAYATLALPALKVLALIDSIFFNLKVALWMHKLISMFGITWLAAFTIPIALLTAAAFYRALLLPKAKNDKSSLKISDIIIFTVVFALPFLIPLSFHLIAYAFCLYFISTRTFSIRQNYLRACNYKRSILGPSGIKSTGNREHDKYIFPEDITLGFEPDEEEVSKMRNITTTGRERQLFALGMIFFLTHLTVMLSKTLTFSIAISLAPFTSTVAISFVVILAICSFVMPLYAYYNKDRFTPEKITNSLSSVQIRNRQDDKTYYENLIDINREANTPKPAGS